jgi:hypothetical protein
MRVPNPWGSGAEVEIDPELSKLEDVTAFGFSGSDVVGERQFLRIKSEHLLCLANGDYTLNEVWVTSDSTLLAIVGGQGYWITVNGSVACKEIRNFPIIKCSEVMQAHLLVVNTFSDFLLLGKDGVDEEVRGVVKDDLEIELEFPILRLSGFLNGAQTTRFYDLVGRTFLT